MDNDPYEQRLRVALEDEEQENDYYNGLPASILYTPCPHFFGRSKETEKLLFAVKDPELYCCCIYGQPGVGKSRLAIEVAHMVRGLDGMANVVYINTRDLTSSGSLKNKIHRKVLNRWKPNIAYEPTDLEVQKELFDETICDVRKLLLVLDRCDKILANDDEHQLFVSMLDEIVSAARRDFTIITTSCTRYRPCCKEQLNLLLEPLGEEDSVQFVVAWYPNDLECPQPAEVKELSKMCGGLPSYLEAVGAVLEKYVDIICPAELLRDMQRDPIKTLDENLKYSKPSTVFGRLFQIMPDYLREAYWCLSLLPSSFSKEDGAHILNMNISEFTNCILTRFSDLGLFHRQQNGKYMHHALIREFALQQAKKADCQQFKQSQERLHKKLVKPLDEAWACFPNAPHRSVELLDCEVKAAHLLETLPSVVQGSQQLYNDHIKVATTYEPMLRLCVPADTRMLLYEDAATEAASHNDVQNEAHVKINLAQTMLEVYEPTAALKQLDDIHCGVVQNMCHDTKFLFSAVRAQILCAQDRAEEAARDLEELATNQVVSVGIEGLYAQFLSNPASVLIKVQLLLALADAYFNQCLHERAIQNYSMVAQLFESVGTHSLACTAVIQMGRCYFKCHDYKRSLCMFEQALDMQEAMSCDHVVLTATKYHIGVTRAAIMELKELSEAESELNRVVAEASYYGSNRLQILASFALGKVSFMMGALLLKDQCEDAAKHYFQSAIKSFKSIQLIHEVTRDNLFMIAEAFAFSGIMKYILGLTGWIPRELDECCQILKSNLNEEELRNLPPVFQVALHACFAVENISSVDFINMILQVKASDSLDNTELDAAFECPCYFDATIAEEHQRGRSSSRRFDQFVEISPDNDEEDTDINHDINYDSDRNLPSLSRTSQPGGVGSTGLGTRCTNSVLVEKQILSHSPSKWNPQEDWNNHHSHLFVAEQDEHNVPRGFYFPQVKMHLTTHPKLPSNFLRRLHFLQVKGQLTCYPQSRNVGVK